MESVTTILPTISLYAPDLIGLILPPIIELLNKDVKEENHRFIVAVIVCFTAAFFVKYNSLVSGDINALITSFSIIFAESQVIFNLYFKKSFLRATMIERLTQSDDPVG